MTARPRHRGVLRGAPLTPDVGVFGGGQAAVRPLGATEPDLHQLHLGAGEEAEAGGVGGHQAGRERDKNGFSEELHHQKGRQALGRAAQGRGGGL